MSNSEYEEQVQRLVQGKVVVIVNKDKKWWDEQFRNGFLTFLEEAEQPVKVMVPGSTFYFNTGLNRHKAHELMRNLFQSR